MAATGGFGGFGVVGLRAMTLYSWERARMAVADCEFCEAVRNTQAGAANPVRAGALRSKMRDERRRCEASPDSAR